MLTSPQRGIKPSFSIALICTTRRGFRRAPVKIKALKSAIWCGKQMEADVVAARARMAELAEDTDKSEMKKGSNPTNPNLRTLKYAR